jgi:hypothetical protein
MYMCEASTGKEQHVFDISFELVGQAREDIVAFALIWRPALLLPPEFL